MKTLCLLLLLLGTKVRAAEDHLTLYLLPSPQGIDWSTPTGLALSLMKNRWAEPDRFMGHVFVEFECRGQYELTGMKAKQTDYLRQLLAEGRGLGVLYHSFEGELEEREDLRPELAEALEAGRVSFIKFLIGRGQCQRLETYLKEYRQHQVGRHYGLSNRPLYGEGASGASFSVSFLEAADLMDQDMRDGWQNHVNIPYELAGPPVTDKKVSFFKLLTRAQWAPENGHHKKLIFWDTDRMFHWVKAKLSAPFPLGMVPLELKKSRGILFDKTQWPTPQHPIWRRDEATGPLKK